MAATGAWADNFSTDAYTANATLNAVSVSTDQTVTINEGVTVTVNNGLSIQSNVTLTVIGGGTLVVNGITGANGNNGYIDTYQESPFDPPVDRFVQPTAGGPGGAAITINSGAQLALNQATVIAIGGEGDNGGMHENGDEAADGANGNGFSSFPAIEGAVLSYSTNGSGYTEYAPGNSTLYRYMKAVAAAAPATKYELTLADGTDDAANWSTTPNSATAGQTVTIKYNGSKKVKSIKAVKKAAVIRTLAEATAEDLGKIAGADGNIYDTKADAAWLLPSQNQWMTMFKAFGDNEASYSGLNAALAAAGGDSSKLQVGYYWSSTPIDEDYAYSVRLYDGDGDAEWYEDVVYAVDRVRACLAF